ncbi:MAG: hypothetical protein L0216_01580 [Planctomycetales bacterium]|nr:hypothetical protein [Planctomycetales bacterium]
MTVPAPPAAESPPQRRGRPTANLPSNYHKVSRGLGRLSRLQATILRLALENCLLEGRGDPEGGGADVYTFEVYAEYWKWRPRPPRPPRPSWLDFAERRRVKILQKWDRSTWPHGGRTLKDGPTPRVSSDRGEWRTSLASVKLFDPSAIGASRYGAARVALCKAFARLEARGLVCLMSGVNSGWRGANLTPEGVAAVELLHACPLAGPGAGG